MSILKFRAYPWEGRKHSLTLFLSVERPRP